MRLVVFGSTGRTGRLVLAEAVRRGYAVTAFARDGAALAGVAGLAAVVEGDARDPEAVLRVVEGQDAVLLAVSPGGVPGGVTAMVRTVTEALAGVGASRLVATSAYGMVARQPYVVASIVRLVLRRTFADQLAADALIEASGLDWTIVRATRLTGAAERRPARLTASPIDRGPYAVGRPAFARVLVDLAGSAGHTGEVLNLSGGRR